MVITNENELVAQKHELVKQIDQETNEKKRNLLEQELGDLNKRIVEDTMRLLSTPASQKVIIEEKKGYSVKELRKIMKDKYAFYQDMAKKAREVYADLVSKKRESNEILELLREEDVKKATSKVLKY